jgi:hypothetical protein
MAPVNAHQRHHDEAPASRRPTARTHPRPNGLVRAVCVAHPDAGLEEANAKLEEKQREDQLHEKV